VNDWTVSASRSASVSFARTLALTAVFSSVPSVSAPATGASLRFDTAIVTWPESVPPLPSETV
jgi:hypothetical protein